MKLHEALTLAEQKSGCVDDAVLGNAVRRVLLKQAHEEVVRDCAELAHGIFLREDYATYPASAPFLNLDAELNTAATGALIRIEAVGEIQHRVASRSSSTSATPFRATAATGAGARGRPSSNLDRGLQPTQLGCGNSSEVSRTSMG